MRSRYTLGLTPPQDTMRLFLLSEVKGGGWRYFRCCHATDHATDMVIAVMTAFPVVE